MERETGMKSCHSATSKRSPEFARTHAAMRVRPRACLFLILCFGLLTGFVTAAADTARVSTNGFSFVDLSSFAIASEAPTARSLSALPDGLQSFNGVPFRIDRPVLVTGIEAARAGNFFPTAVTGIKVG